MHSSPTRTAWTAPATDGIEARILRRVYLDLIGLSPTPGSSAFDDDHSPDAKRWSIVCWPIRVTANVGAGIGWISGVTAIGRLTWQAGARQSATHLRWRDWIVESLNADKGYDRMIIEMLVGDEPVRIDLATLRDRISRPIGKCQREQWLEDTVTHRAGFLESLGCANVTITNGSIPQTDYYQVRGDL
jgi:hypothetical protein